MMKRVAIMMLSVVALLMMALPAVAEEKPAKGKADAFFAEKNHDFGYIREDKGPVSYTFEFENVGEEPLIVVSASASCGCTRPEYPTKPIKAGKKSKIKVTFNPIGRPGPFRKEVRVRTNGRHKVITLHIEGSVIPVGGEKEK
ncbi:MAG: DUF1573 domain-containing protein [Bacteroidales bacterium]|nr:DUF1573 domain-containing protein [Bacteroidales bacterium]